jgi:hypothetical protein
MTESPPSPQTFIGARIAIAAIALAISAGMLFIHLDHYALWDDESLVALIGQGVWRTGDTTAINGDNIVAYRDGLLLKGLKDRSSPPLQYYIVAPFVGLLGPHAWAVRLPMAMMGVACVGLMFWWLWMDRADVQTWVLLALALVGNVSFFLYFRQCRYYGPSMLLLTATAFVWTHLHARRSVIILSAILVLLLTANYLTYAACAAMLLVDYVFWERKRRRLDWLDWIIVLLPQIVFGSLVVWIWNPASINETAVQGSWLADRLQLLWWNLRDAALCEYGATALLIAAPFFAFFGRKTGVARATAALAVGIVALTLVSPQKTQDAMAAGIRYLSSMLPLYIAVEVLTLRAICGRWTRAMSWVIGIPAACILFGTNALQGTWLSGAALISPMRSSIGLFAEELADPPPDPYTVTAAWINGNVPAQSSIWILPDFMCYPLMFHAPNAVYAWQLDGKAGPAFASLPAINFEGRVPPDYIIVFGRAAKPSNSITPDGIIQYPLVATLNVYGRDLFRPELLQRIFRPLPGFDPSVDGVRIYKR